MDECKVCANADNEYCFACDEGSQFVPMTNGDRIRALEDEELAKWLAEIADCVACETMFDMKCRCHHEFFLCWQAWLDWLKKEATNDQNNS